MRIARLWRPLCILPVVASLMVMFAGPVPAAESKSRLLDYFAELNSLEADFEQVTLDRQGRDLERSQGRMHIQRPGRFRWSYEVPYEQLIVTDSETLWVYDPDLDQVSVSELDTTVGNTPALLLSTEQPLEDLFRIIGPEHDNGIDWLALEPLDDQESNFTRIFLGFEDDELKVMEIVDGFEQTVQIRFSNIRRDAEIDPALFEFVPPEGVDVVR